MNPDNQFKTLSNDEDVLRFRDDTFTVGRFKDLIKQQVNDRFQNPLENKSVKVYNILSGISIGQAFIKLGDIQWNSVNEGLSCQLLRIGSNGWESGKVRTKISIKIIPAQTSKAIDQLEIHIYLGFASD